MRARPALAVLALALAGLGLTAPAAFASASPMSAATTQRAAIASTSQPSSPSAAARERTRVQAYWTSDRMRRAIPRDARPRRAGSVSPALGSTPGTGIVSGSSWTKGGWVAQRTGKIFFSVGFNNYVCSGAVVTDGARAGYSLIVTAGHCVWDVDEGAWVTNWLFVPNYDAAPAGTCSQTVHGCWTAAALVAHTAYTTASSYNLTAMRADWGFAVVGPGGKTGTSQLDAVVGTEGISFSRVPSGRTLYSFGYPAASPYAGADLVYCKGPVSTDLGTNGTTYALGCLMTGGSSGGPWLSGFSESTGYGTVVSVNSYKYDNDTTKMYGPIFGTRTQATYNAALTATVNTAVSGG